MYEPRVIKKQGVRCLTGTPASKVNVFINLTMFLIPSIVIWAFSLDCVKKKKFILDLEEINYSSVIFTEDAVRKLKNLGTFGIIEKSVEDRKEESVNL